MPTKFEVILGDITEQEVDAIVNAANESLGGGGGVDGAIHEAAGPEMTDECLDLYGCPPGQARITGGYRLPAKYIIHTVGPVWRDGEHDEDEILTACYRNCIHFAEMQGLKTLAFPCISTGAFGFPTERACGVAVQVVRRVISQGSSLELVRFVCFEHEDYVIYRRALAGIAEFPEED